MGCDEGQATPTLLPGPISMVSPDRTGARVVVVVLDVDVLVELPLDGDVVLVELLLESAEQIIFVIPVAAFELWDFLG